MTHQWVDKNQMVLFGHRSIVNQVRYNHQKCIIASSGVEKIIKVTRVGRRKNMYDLNEFSSSCGLRLKWMIGLEV